MEETPVTLVSIGEGAAVELFDIELERVLKNIADSNTDPDGVREINVKFRIKPKQDRVLGEVRITATSKLVGAKPHESVMYMVKRGGQVSAVETHAPEQTTLDNLKPMPIRTP